MTEFHLIIYFSQVTAYKDTDSTQHTVRRKKKPSKYPVKLVKT